MNNFVLTPFTQYFITLKWGEAWGFIFFKRVIEITSWKCWFCIRNPLVVINRRRRRLQPTPTLLRCCCYGNTEHQIRPAVKRDMLCAPQVPTLLFLLLFFFFFY